MKSLIPSHSTEDVWKFFGGSLLQQSNRHSTLSGRDQVWTPLLTSLSRWSGCPEVPALTKLQCTCQSPREGLSKHGRCTALERMQFLWFLRLSHGWRTGHWHHHKHICSLNGVKGQGWSEKAFWRSIIPAGTCSAYTAFHTVVSFACMQHKLSAKRGYNMCLRWGFSYLPPLVHKCHGLSLCWHKLL